MSEFRPLVLDNGKVSQLKSTDTLLAKIIEVDVAVVTAKEAVSAGMAVYVSGANAVHKAIADDDAKTVVLGLAVASAAADASVHVQTNGVVEISDWTGAVGSTELTVGADYFLDGVAGKLTSTVPTTGNLAYIGRAIAATRLEVKIDRPIRLA